MAAFGAIKCPLCDENLPIVVVFSDSATLRMPFPRFPRALPSPTSFRYISRDRAGIAQLVERQLPKLNVAGSNPVARSYKCRMKNAECGMSG